jgi:hypothetical protein
MRGGGGSEIGGRGTGGDDSYNMQVCTSIYHGGCCCPMAAMGPHSQLLSIQQSANILWNRSTLLKLEKTIINKGSTKRTLCGIVLFKLNTFFSHVFACP